MSSRFLLRGLAAPVLHFALVKTHGRIVGGGPANGQVALRQHIGAKPMDDRIEAFLADVLALEGGSVSKRVNSSRAPDDDPTLIDQITL